MNRRVFVFASDWHFLPEGVKKAQEEFDAQSSATGLNARIVYRHESHSFLIESLPTKKVDKAYTIFLEVFKGIINGGKDEVEYSDDSSDSDDEDIKVLLLPV
jgi:hypothetical protein